MNSLQRWLAALAATVAVTAAAFFWLDRPIASFVHNEVLHEHQALFAKLTHIPEPLVPLAVVAFVLMGLAALSGRTLTRWQTVLFVAAVGLVMAETTKTGLKYVFGRTWPETWVNNNPSFIRDGAFGFNWFHGGAGYASFPSGHMSVTCALAAALWIGYPRWRVLWALMVLAVAVGLVGANYHFLSDVIAGSFLGASTGWMVTVLCERRASLRSPGAGA